MLAALSLLLAVRVLPAPDNSGPFRQPNLAAAGSTIAVVYGSPDRIWFARSTDSGASFGSPAEVAGVPGLMLGNRRGPRVALAGKRVLVTAIAGGNLLLWSSEDGGKHWSAARTVNDVPEAAREGFQAITTSADGRHVLITWLDLRTKGMKLYGTVSRDGGQTWEPNRQVYASPDGHICECCHTSSAIGNDGTMYVMWRNWLNGNRDMYLARSFDGGRTWKEQKLGDGSGQLNACPMDGGSLVVGADGAVTTAWRRDKTVYLSVPGKPERELGAGKQPVLMLTDKGVVAVWTEGTALRLLAPGTTEARTLTPSGNFASMAGGVAAWEDNGQILVERIGIR